MGPASWCPPQHLTAVHTGWQPPMSFGVGQVGMCLSLALVDCFHHEYLINMSRGHQVETGQASPSHTRADQHLSHGHHSTVRCCHRLTAHMHAHSVLSQASNPAHTHLFNTAFVRPCTPAPVPLLCSSRACIHDMQSSRKLRQKSMTEVRCTVRHRQ